MKTSQRGFFTEEQWETFLKIGIKEDRDFLDQVVKRWEEAADEIARLRDALGDNPPADQERDHLASQCAVLLYENEQLHGYVQYEGLYLEEKRENERLRKALEQIADWDECGPGVNLARAALKDKP